MQTVFVTGSEGLAGTHLCEHLAQSGFEVVAGVRNRARKLAYERSGHKALVCDVTDAINVARAIASVRPDVVIHLAGSSHPADAVHDPLLAYQSIVSGWTHVLDAVRRAVPRAKLVMASASDVYGDVGKDAKNLDEQCPAQPVSMFGFLKQTAEAIAHTFHRSYHVNVCIARPFHYLGRGVPERSFFGTIARRLANCWTTGNGTPLTLPDLDGQWDLLHVRDVATAYERIVECGLPNETYNICSGRTISCRAVVELIAAEFGLELEFAESPSTPEGAHAPALCGDNSKSRSELGWQPTHSLNDAVRDLVASCREAQAAA